MVAADDAGWRACKRLTGDFTMQPDGSLVRVPLIFDRPKHGSVVNELNGDVSRAIYFRKVHF